MKNKLKKFFKQLFCQHDNLISDTQIRVIKCDDCEMKRWYKYDNIYK